MKSKKRYGVVIVSVIMLMIAGVLMINKDSYAIGYSNYGYSCPEYLLSNSVPEEVSYIKNGNNKITLPDWTYDTLERSGLPSFMDDFTVFVFNAHYFDKVEEDYNGRINPYYLINDSNSFRLSGNYDILLGYLVNVPKFSSDVEENYYYQQLLIFWAMDRMMGFDDDKNYYVIGDDDNFEFVELPKDNSYEDKYYIEDVSDEYGQATQYTWKYINNLSAGDKEMLKNSDVGDQMLAYLDTWDKYVDWKYNTQGNLDVELNSISQSDISYHVTNDYIETQLIHPNSDGKAYEDQLKSYTVKVSSPLVVVDSNGNEQTKFSGGQGFKVRIPISKIKNQNIDYSIKINADYEFQTTMIYDVPPGRMELSDEERLYLYASMMYAGVQKGCSSTENASDSLSLEFSQRIGNLNVKVIDSSTGKNLSRAKVVIYDLKGNEVYSYETTDDELNITLPVGEYIVKQTVTPPNYEAQTIQMRVDVTEEGTADAVLENAPLINVPDTAMNSIIFVIIGGLIVIAGGILLVTNLRKKKVS